MTILRWILGSIAVLFGGGFLVLVLLANAFRKSFSASEHGPLFIILPVAGAILLLASILFPSSKPLLHLAAVAAVAGIGSANPWVDQSIDLRLRKARGDRPIWRLNRREK